jgi:hypothetical protein
MRRRHTISQALLALLKAIPSYGWTGRYLADGVIEPLTDAVDDTAKLEAALQVAMNVNGVDESEVSSVRGDLLRVVDVSGCRAIGHSVQLMKRDTRR